MASFEDRAFGRGPLPEPSGLCAKLNRYREVRGPNSCIDPESEELLTGGENAWVRTGRYFSDYLFGRLVTAKSVIGFIVMAFSFVLLIAD